MFKTDNNQDLKYSIKIAKILEVEVRELLIEQKYIK